MRRVLVSGGRVALGTPGSTPPLFATIDEVLSAHLGVEASAFVQAVFSFHDPDEVRDLMGDAGFDEVDAETRPLPLLVPPPADFLWQYVHSTLFAGLAAQLDDETRANLERDMVEWCRPFLHGDALVMEPGLLVATARRKREDR